MRYESMLPFPYVKNKPQLPRLIVFLPARCGSAVFYTVLVDLYTTPSGTSRVIALGKSANGISI